MRKALLIVCALLCCGFTIVTDEMVRDRAKLCERIRATYGEKRLSGFVRDIVAQHPDVDGVKLSAAKVGERWLTMDWNPFWHVISEDWAMAVKSDQQRAKGFAEFTLFWKCDDNHGIFVEGHREKSGSLKMDSIRREEIVEINWL